MANFALSIPRHGRLCRRRDSNSFEFPDVRASTFFSRVIRESCESVFQHKKKKTLQGALVLFSRLRPNKKNMTFKLCLETVPHRRKNKRIPVREGSTDYTPRMYAHSSNDRRDVSTRVIEGRSALGVQKRLIMSGYEWRRSIPTDFEFLILAFVFFGSAFPRQTSVL